MFDGEGSFSIMRRKLGVYGVKIIMCVECLWIICGMSVECVWNVNQMFVETCGMSVDYLWNVCLWNVCGMCVECVGNMWNVCRI